MNHIAQRLRSLAARTALDGIAEEMRAIADELVLAQQAQEPVYWEWRHLGSNQHAADFGQWSQWQKVEARSLLSTVEDALQEFRRYIADGYKYELRALYTTPPTPQVPAPSQQPAASVGPKCRDCADFGPICPNNGKPCDSQKQPAAPVVSDEQIDAATRHMYHNGRPTTKEYRVGIVRAILALRPAVVPMTDGVFDLICGAIDKADTVTMEGDYMMDSDDCIAVVRVMQALLSVRGIAAKEAEKP